jgi:rfaE bifunctional protein nucleotidyltransferase chain/domain
MLVSLNDLQAQVEQSPEQWRPLVLTNGCFDLLHVGHVRYLQSARALGRSLVVGLNSDHSVRQLKGKSRPFVPEHQRAEILSALRAVSAVVIFQETTADRLIRSLRPDIYVKGGDYQPDNLPEWATLCQYHIPFRTIAVEVPTSTSAIAQRIYRAMAWLELSAEEPQGAP